MAAARSAALSAVSAAKAPHIAAEVMMTATSAGHGVEIGMTATTGAAVVLIAMPAAVSTGVAEFGKARVIAEVADRSDPRGAIGDVGLPTQTENPGLKLSCE